MIDYSFRVSFSFLLRNLFGVLAGKFLYVFILSHGFPYFIISGRISVLSYSDKNLHIIEHENLLLLRSYYIKKHRHFQE